MTGTAAGGGTLPWISTEEAEKLLFAICFAGLLLLLLAVCYCERNQLSLNFLLGQFAWANKEDEKTNVVAILQIIGKTVLLVSSNEFKFCNLERELQFCSTFNTKLKCCVGLNVCEIKTALV